MQGGSTYDPAVLHNFLTGEELDGDALGGLVRRALELKREAREARSRPLAGRAVALLFERPSTRTRVSFEAGVAELGGHPIAISGSELQLARGESIRDTALVLSRYVDVIGLRTGPHQTLEELAEHSEVPVVNMLTEAHHPCQALADVTTLYERFGRLSGLKVAYVGDGNNVAHSLMLIGAAMGLEVVIATPPELPPDPGVVDRAIARASDAGSVALTAEAGQAAPKAHAVYADTWVSMGDEGEGERRRALLAPYRLDDELLSLADADAVALHCLPAHPGEEITAEVLYGERSAVWDQAENRLHAQKALLELLVAHR
jgi:ornithine carbamoyltransferase